MALPWVQWSLTAAGLLWHGVAEFCPSYTDHQLKHHAQFFCPEYCCGTIHKEYCCNSVLHRLNTTERSEDPVEHSRFEEWSGTLWILLGCLIGSLLTIAVIIIGACYMCCREMLQDTVCYAYRASNADSQQNGGWQSMRPGSRSPSDVHSQETAIPLLEYASKSCASEKALPRKTPEALSHAALEGRTERSASDAISDEAHLPEGRVNHAAPV